jgi:hypothetical protein
MRSRTSRPVTAERMPAQYHPGMAHYLFNFSEGDQEQAAALLRAKMWGIGGDEKHGDALAPADLVLIYLAPPKQEFIGQAELASAVHDWTAAEAEVYPGDSPCGVGEILPGLMRTGTRRGRAYAGSGAAWGLV